VITYAEQADAVDRTSFARGQAGQSRKAACCHAQTVQGGNPDRRKLEFAIRVGYCGSRKEKDGVCKTANAHGWQSSSHDGYDSVVLDPKHLFSRSIVRGRRLQTLTVR
jgi:hypothetical protein